MTTDPSEPAAPPSNSTVACPRPLYRRPAFVRAAALLAAVGAGALVMALATDAPAQEKAPTFDPAVTLAADKAACQSANNIVHVVNEEGRRASERNGESLHGQVWTLAGRAVTAVAEDRNLSPAVERAISELGANLTAFGDDTIPAITAMDSIDKFGRICN